MHFLFVLNSKSKSFFFHDAMPVFKCLYYYPYPTSFLHLIFFPLPIFSPLSYFFPVYRSGSAAVCQPVQPAGDSASPRRSKEFLFAESLACPRGKCCRMRSCRLWMTSSRVVRASYIQCRRRNCPVFDPSILQNSGI